MSRSERWLHAFGHALAAHALYGAGHQARREASMRLYAALQDLLAADLRPTFTFLDDAVLYRTTPLLGLRDWTWGRRLGANGVRRLEFTPAATLDGMDQLLATLHQRLSGVGDAPALGWPGIEAGDVEAGSQTPLPALVVPGDAPPGPDFQEEMEVMRFCCGRLARGEPVPADEITALVRALGLALHGDRGLEYPREAGDAIDGHAGRAINTALLAMRLSDWLGFGGDEQRAIGRAALLHDIGMLRLPAAVFALEQLDDAGRQGVARHPEDGARFLFAQSGEFELAAVTAYEHHFRMDGTGYPARRAHGEAHYVSRMIGLCGVYDALRSPRSYRAAREHDAALAELRAGQGTVHDPELVEAFVSMMANG